MPTPEMLSDEQAALIWSGQTSSIAGLQEIAKPEAEVQDEPEKKEEKETAPVTEKKEETKDPSFTDEDISKIFRGESEEEKKESSETSENDEKTGEKPKGRKQADLVSLINEMVESEELSGFEEGPVKTIDEAKELFKANLKNKQEEAESTYWNKKVVSYSPQIQAILHYAEQGGTDVTTLLGAISQVERTASLTTNSEEGQVAVVTEVLKLKGFDDEEIKEQIETFKDLDKLKSKADKYLPELTQYKQHQVQRMLEDETQRQQEAMEASKNYINVIHQTLQKDNIGGIKLQREDKAKVFEALAFPKFRSISGVGTNGFVKTLEDLQFGKDADYERFLNIVYYAVDPDGFMNKIQETLQNKVTSETVKKLKTAKSTLPNTEEELGSTKPVKKNTVTKSEFRNPFA